jgi:futalosine hydrolase
MHPILVIAAVRQEIADLTGTMNGIRIEDPVFPESYCGEINGKKVVTAVVGIGKANSAGGVTALVLRHAPRIVIITGCAGAYPESGLETGQLALAASEVFGDEGVLTCEGWKGLEEIGISVLERKGTRYFNEIPLSFSLAEQAIQLASALDLPLRRGRFITVSTCSGTSSRGRELFRLFGGLCENMEGAAAALVAMQYGIDCLEVRGISNLVEDRDLSRWNIQLAVEQAQRFVYRYIERCC